jgi:hypothetical protein
VSTTAHTALPIVCAWCDRVLTSPGRWESTDVAPVSQKATHGICPDCLTAQKREARLLADFP